MTTAPYIDRLQARLAHRPIGVFIPRNHQAEPFCRLLKGTAIVSDRSLLSGGLIEVYYEGNKYGACNLLHFEDKALCAVGRLIQRYPTVAKMWVKPESLKQVGYISVVKLLPMPLPESLKHMHLSAVRKMLPKHLLDAIDPCEEAVCVISEKYDAQYRSWLDVESTSLRDAVSP
ncbi:hypothetical protein [Zhongshania marina]|uniref:Uncharacterized protein n=1 Tax=Zhongshania marina TaxID=2304603 RepID=A0A2S4HC88_9GAMM|nr:hypothetical protein [Marortus luteolus]POP51549.1 hypothetical protein C0068_16565 [Marortus luteolus]